MTTPKSKKRDRVRRKSLNSFLESKEQADAISDFCEEADETPKPQNNECCVCQNDADTAIHPAVVSEGQTRTEEQCEFFNIFRNESLDGSSFQEKSCENGTYIVATENVGSDFDDNADVWTDVVETIIPYNASAYGQTKERTESSNEIGKGISNYISFQEQSPLNQEQSLATENLGPTLHDNDDVGNDVWTDTPETTIPHNISREGQTKERTDSSNEIDKENLYDISCQVHSRVHENPPVATENLGPDFNKNDDHEMRFCMGAHETTIPHNVTTQVPTVPDERNESSNEIGKGLDDISVESRATEKLSVTTGMRIYDLQENENQEKNLDRKHSEDVVIEGQTAIEEVLYKRVKERMDDISAKNKLIEKAQSTMQRMASAHDTTIQRRGSWEINSLINNNSSMSYIKVISFDLGRGGLIRESEIIMFTPDNLRPTFCACPLCIIFNDEISESQHDQSCGCQSAPGRKSFSFSINEGLLVTQECSESLCAIGKESVKDISTKHNLVEYPEYPESTVTATNRGIPFQQSVERSPNISKSYRRHYIQVSTPDPSNIGSRMVSGINLITPADTQVCICECGCPLCLFFGGM